MRTVFNNANDVIHLFAQRTQDEARSSNIFFSKDTIYSYGYHYVLAYFIDEKNIFINDDGYSRTTAKHISYVSYATRQYKRWFAKRCDIGLVYNQIVSAKDSLINARKPERYISEINSLWRSLNEYLEFYHKLKKIPKKNSNQYLDVRYKEMKSIVRKINNDTDKEKLISFEKNKIKQSKRREEKQIREAISMFNKYEIQTFRIGSQDYLRVSKDGTKVETSQGIKVSVESAKHPYTLIKNKVDVVGRDIDGYTVNSINGVLTIGCHRINMDSVRKIGEKLLKQK